MRHPSQNKVVSVYSRRACACLTLAALAGGLGGCEVDSFIDPSQTGRFETTPTIVPVLERLHVVEGGDNVNPNTYSAVSAQDLVAEPESYRMGPGDGIVVKIQDLVELGREEMFERVIDDRGFIEIPRLGQVYVAGQTGDEAGQTVGRALKTRRILTDPNVDVNAVQRRRQTYSVLGGVMNPGTYNIPKPDFRLLEALSNSGRFSENVQWVYVIRTVSLEAASTAPRTAPTTTTPPPGTDTTPVPAAPQKKDSVIDLIDSLGAPPPAADPKPPASTPPTTPPGNPGVMGQPIDVPAAKPETPVVAETPATKPVQVPAIDIDTAAKPAAPANGTESPPLAASEWQFVNGQWVKGGAAKSAGPDVAVGGLSQRVIQIPMQALMNGAAQYNIVVRPGDTIRVQSLNEGIVYVHGNVNRPGVYNLPTTGRMTLIRAIAAASDLAEIGVPERVDITRFIGPDRQATVRVNYRAIVEGTQPDFVMRDGDVVNVGTTFWAYPLAVLRNGLRLGWGFDFVLDRNFGYDIFGPQNTGQQGF